MNVRAGVSKELKGLWAGGTGLSLGAVAVGWGLLVGSRMIYPVIIPSLQTTYGLSLTLAGSLVTITWLFGSLGQLPGGMLADRYDERSILAASTVVVACALALIVTTPTTVVLFLASALWGLGQSLYPIARITLLSDLYPDRLGSALGVTMATGDVGQTLLPPVAGAIAVAVAWQAGLGFVIPLVVLAGLSILVVVPAGEADEHATDAGSSWDAPTVLAELRNPAMGSVAVILFLYIFIWQSFTSFYPTYLTTIKGLSPTVASVLFGLFFAVGVITKPIAGMAYDSFGMRRTLIGLLLPSAAGFLLLPTVENVWLLAGITALVSGMLGTGAVTQSFLAETFSDSVQGAGLGVVRTASATLAASGPVVFGLVADNGYFDEGYVALSVLIVAVILLTIKMPRV